MSKHIALPRLTQLAASIAVAVGGLAFVPAANAAAPAAGTNISNIATASYTDSFGATKTSTSNEVKTTVVQIASFTLTADQRTTANPNGLVNTLVHTLTNTGNGDDTFRIDLANVANGTNYTIGGVQDTDAYDFSNIKVYLDANGDGVADNLVDIKGTDISVAKGASVGLVVVVTTAGTASNGDAGLIRLTATNVFSASGTGGSNAATAKTNTDSVKIVAGAVIQVTKAVNVTTASVGQEIEYTLEYKNTGNDKATNVVLTDDLSVADLANVTYKAGSAISSSLGALNDGTGDSDGYVYNSVTKKITFTIPEVAANSTATLKFKVTVNTGATPGNIKNVAQFDPDGTGPAVAQNTNPVTTSVAGTYKGSINDSELDDFADNVTPNASIVDPNSNKNDSLTATTSQGVPVSFGGTSTTETIWVHNTGNIAETFNLTAINSTLPTGSIIELLKADGSTPLVDTNGDPIKDTGEIPAGDKVKIVVKVTLPANDTGSGVPYTVDINAKPVHNPSLNDKVTLSITAVTANRVDLSNGKGDRDGNNNDTPNAGEGSYATNGGVIDTNTTAPGVTTTFPLAVTNFGTVPDNFNISSNLPAGWTVQYFSATDSSGTTCGAQVTNTGNVNPVGSGPTAATGSTVYLCAKVTPPANATPADSKDIVFTVTSQGTNLSDSIKDHITISEIRNLLFTPDRNGQVAPGGAIQYSHILTNNGNVTEGTGATVFTYSLPTHAGNLGATTSVYIDVNNNGLADNDELVTDQTKLNSLLALAGNPGGTDPAKAGLQPGESVTVLVKVEAPSGATAGQVDTSTVTFIPTAGNAVSIKDITTVNVGQVELLKEQAEDLNCDGNVDTGKNYTQGIINAKPGQCVLYRITATNKGNADVTKVVINDSTPAYTTISTVASNDSTVGTVAGPAVGAAGNVSNNVTPNAVDKLTPTSTARLKFGVKINN